MWGGGSVTVAIWESLIILILLPGGNSLKEVMPAIFSNDCIIIIFVVFRHGPKPTCTIITLNGGSDKKPLSCKPTCYFHNTGQV